MKIYIAGKITGLPKAEYTAKFLQAELALRAAGLEPVNPCNFGIPDHTPSARALVLCKPQFDQCEAVYFLRDWKDSFGAIIEHSWASHQKMKVYYEREHPIEFLKKAKEESV